jgi:hypothetical protein
MPWLAALLAHCAASILTCPPESKVFYYPLGTQDRADQVIVQGSNLLLLLTATPPHTPRDQPSHKPYLSTAHAHCARLETELERQQAALSAMAWRALCINNSCRHCQVANAE